MEETMLYKYSVEMFIEGEWQTHIRYYTGEKDLKDFDLHDVPNKRKNAKFLGLINGITGEM